MPEPPALPTLEELAANPGLVEQIPPGEAWRLMLQAAGVGALVPILAARAVGPFSMNEPTSTGEVLLDVHAAAKKLGVSSATLRRRAGETPYRELRVETGARLVRFSSRLIEAWQQQTRQAVVADPPHAPPPWPQRKAAYRPGPPPPADERYWWRKPVRERKPSQPTPSHHGKEKGR